MTTDAKIGLSGAFLALAIFALDLTVPLGVAAGVPYVALVLLGLWSTRTDVTLALAAAGTLLTILGFFLSEPAGIPWMVVFNRGLALFAIWSVAGVMILRLGSNARWRRDLERLVNARTTDFIKEYQSRMRAEDDLRQQAEIMEQLNDAVITTDPEGVVTGWNKGAERMYGYTPDEIIGQDVTILTPPEDRRACQETMWQPFLEQGTMEQEARRVRKNGEVFDCQINLTLQRGADGEPTGVIGINLDITERKRAEEALAKSEAEFREIFDSSPDGISIADMNKRHVHANQAFLDMLGYTLEELQELTFEEITPKRWSKREQEAVRQLLETGERYEYEKEYIRKDGTVFPVALKAWRVEDRDGNVNHLMARVQDITERKQAEEALAKSEREYRDIFDTSPDGILLTDSDGRLVGTNRAFQVMLGYTAGEMKAQSISSLTPERWAEADQRAIDNLLESDEVQEFEKEYIRKDGTTFAADLQAWRLTDADGRTTHFLGRVQDITERKRAQAELLLARDQAEQASRAKSEFLSSMSHELRTPLNAIMGYAQLLEQPADMDQAERHRFGREIMQAGGLLLNLVDQVLEMADIDAGGVARERQPVPLGEVIEVCLKEAREPAERNGISITTNPAPETAPAVMADPDGLRQVLKNLLSNAVKYNRENGDVLVTWKTVEGGRLRVSVADTGPGIPEQQQAGLFEAFNRLGAKNSAIEGAGVGLTIAKALTELMGGRIGFESTLGAGTTFWVEFQLAEDPKGDEAGETTATGEGPSRPTVLYVEDNPSNLRLMEMIFDQWPDLDLLAAPTAEMGLELARTAAPELVIMDINLPGMDGFEALEALRQDPATKEIPVIALSADVAESDRKRGLEAGFQEYLAKPLDVAELASVLSTILGDRLIPRANGGTGERPPIVH